MNTYPQEFYNPLAIALNGATLQDFLDEILAENNTLELTGFTFNDDLLPDFTYEQIQRTLGMEVMASYVDLDSPAIPVSTEGDVIGTGKIPRMKSVEYYNEDKLRKLKLAEDRRSISREEIINKAGVELGGIFAKLVTRHTNSLTYQRHQMVSTGKLELTDTNNPNGVKNITLGAHVPTANKKIINDDTKWWTDKTKATEGAKSDPIKDMQNMVKAANKKGARKVHFEVNSNFLDAILGHSKVVAALAANLFPLADVAVATGQIAYMERARKFSALKGIVGVDIVEWDTLVSVERFNRQTGLIERPEFDAFDDNVLVLVPDGSLGEILTVEPILLEGGDYGFAFGRKLAVTIGKDYVKKCQSYNSEMTSLVVPDKPQYMWYLYPCNG